MHPTDLYCTSAISAALDDGSSWLTEWSISAMTKKDSSEVEGYFKQIEEIRQKVGDEFRAHRAVMFTDITASTAFFANHGDFEGVYLLYQYTQEMIPVIQKHGGEVVKTLGDGLLVVFADPVEACRAAIEMQLGTSRVNPKLGSPEEIAITVALHYGEVFFYREDVFGDVINTTSRISSLTNPGTILLSQDMKQQVADSEFAISYATKSELKGKPQPMVLHHLHWNPSEVQSLTSGKATCAAKAFVSTVTPHIDKQVRFIEAFSRRLYSMGIEPCFQKKPNYGKLDPISNVQRQIEACDLVIILGLERSHVYYLKDKENSQQEEESVHRKYTSSWLHLEAGLAHALGKEIFVLCNPDICSDGIFDREWYSYKVREIPELDAMSDEMNEFFEDLKEWLADFRETTRESSLGE